MTSQVAGDLADRIRVTIRRLFVAALVCLVAAWSTAALATAGPAAARQAASLTVSLDEYYAGQGMVFSGSLPKAGAQKIWLEFNMNRPGDTWTVVDGSTHVTDAAGRFSFTHAAPAMYGISLRVNSAAGPTPQRVFNAVDEMVTLDVAPAGGRWSTRITDGGYRAYTSYPAVAGDPFVVTVDTAPEGGPILAGRKVELQQRVDASTWTTVDTGTVGAGGLATFRRTIAGPGVVVYRAVTAAWTAGGSTIGSNPSFPTYVYVHDASGHGPSPARAATTPATTTTRTTTAVARSTAPLPSAAPRYGWGGSLWDFGYEWGESLADAPFRGSRERGSWRESSTGTGWVGRHNGSMFFESKYGVVAPRDAGSGDLGTTSATLTGNASTYGRWEFRMRTWEIAERGASYHVRAELVPADASQRACGARSITIADITPSTDEVRFGASSPDGSRTWSGRRGVEIPRLPHSYGVEVAADHLTWFLDGSPVGTVRNAAAVPGVPLTFRLSLVGDGTSEMRHTYAATDWIRSWDLTRGRQTTGGGALTAGHATTAC